MTQPLYLKIKENILASIEDLPANSPLPSERLLSGQYGASRMTVRKAVEQLVNEGYLYRDKNKGTFKADEKMHKKQETAIVSDDDETKHKIIYFDIKERVEHDISTYLGTAKQDLVLRVVRQIVKKNEVISLEEIYIARKNVTDDDLGNLKEILDMKKYIDQGSITQMFEPMIVPLHYAQLLQMKMNEPIIRIDTIINSKDGSPFAFVKTFNNPLKKKIEITL